jgi:hypothetical protein
VSAFLPNGSSIDIAKVEGDATYKAYMLGSREEPTKTVSAKWCPFSQRICQHWPFKSIQTPNALAPILRALVTAAESTLETSVKSVAVSAYDIGTIDHKLTKDDVRTALSELGVDSYDRLDHVVRQLAPALGLRGKCSEPYTLPDDLTYHHDPEQIFFAIEYTRDALTAGLWREECGAMEMTGRLTPADLGLKAMQSCRGETAENKQTCEESFKSALRSVSTDSSRNKHEELSAVLAFGECADDEALLTTLRQVLGEQYPNGDSVDLSRVRDFSSDLAFAGSRAMAKIDWAARGSKHEVRHMEEL